MPEPTNPLATWTTHWHKDGHGLETFEYHLTREEAMDWLLAKSAKCGQPIQQDDSGFFVNESAEEWCGYFCISHNKNIGD